MHATATSLEQLGFPESLRWHEGALVLSDMFRSRVIEWVPGQEPRVLLDRARGGPEMPGGIGWLPDGSMLVVDCLERRVLRVRDNGVSVHADLSGLLAHPANDMIVDPDGTAWVGGYGFDPQSETPVASPLWRVAPDGSVAPSTARYVFPNGGDRRRDGRLLIAETFADRVSVDLGDRTEVELALPPGSGPDGISIAPDQTLYVALAFTGALVAVDLRIADPTARALHLVHQPEPEREGPGAGALGVYDCAVRPDGRLIAVAIASADESLAARVDTGRVLLLEL
jgi:sugar lactone lactonase YvrE